jgi:uncharacterized protein YbbC (DUF1343 family)
MSSTGTDRLRASSSLQKQLRGAKVALLAHPASVDRSLVHVSDVLDVVGVKPVIVFGPEHGYGGEAQDMIGVEDAKDARGVPIRSLYGARFDDLSPRAEDLRGVDVLLVDLQDVGARYYTFVWTAVLVMRACAKAGVHVLVLDRPNPIGAEIEGRMQEDGKHLSFVGLEPIAVRHGNTLGEIVAWRADVEKLPREQVGIVACEGFDRAAHAPSWDRAFVMPSPNMPTYETALVYPGGCLLEGTNLSEGRGTTRPFEIFGAPWIDGARLANDFHAVGLVGVRARPLTFRPTFQKHAGKNCGGVQLHVTDAHAFRPYAAYLALVALARQQDPDRFAFRTESYEFRDDVPAFDLLTGGARARELISAGASAREVIDAVAGAGEREMALHRDAESAAKRRTVRC